MSKKRPYHHWVPQPLLRALSADGKSVVQYSRRVGEAACKEASIKRAAASQDSFSKDVEAVLSSIEGAAAPAIKAFQRMMHPLAIDSVSKSIVACYLAGFLWYRSPRVRATQLAGVTKAELVNWGRDEARAMAAVSDEARQLYLERLPQVAEAMAADPNRLMAGHWWAGNMARWTLYSMSWTVLHCPKPIVAIPDCGMIHQGELALLNEAAELYLPLSADRILVASWRGAPGLVQYAHATPAHVGKINRMGYGLADRFVYARTYRKAVEKQVRGPPRRKPSRLPPVVVQGESPTASRLNGLRELVRSVGFETLERDCCAAPGAGLTASHRWQDIPVELPTIKELPEHTAPVAICQWCGAVRRTLANGGFHQDDLEQERMKRGNRIKNWWQMFTIEPMPRGIRAHGEMPLYRFEDDCS